MNSGHFVRLQSGIENDGGYSQILMALLRRKVWIIGALLGALGVSTWLTIQEPPTYESSMQLLVEPNYRSKSQNPDAKDQFADGNIEVDTATQISVMQSSELLKQAMALLTAKYPEIDPKDPASVSAFKGSISITQVSASSGSKKSAESTTKIFQVTYADTDPRKTRTVLKALKKVFLDYNLEQQRLRLERGLAFINEQLPQIKSKVQQSEAALERFRRSQDLVDPEAQSKAQVESLSRIQDEQRTNLAQIRELNSRYAGLQQKLAMAPQRALLAARLSQSPRYQTLLGEIQKSELAIEQQRLRFKNNVPFVQQLVEQRDRQLRLLTVEASRILGNATSASGEALISGGQLSPTDLTLVNQLIEAQANLQASQARYTALANAEQQIRAQLKRLPQLLAEYGRLQPEVELNRDTFKELLKARQQLGLEIARGGFGWQVLEEPQLGYKTGPSLPRNLMLGAVVGLLLGGAAAYAREAADDAIHTSEDLKKQTAVPLLGIIAEAPQNLSLNGPIPFGQPQELTLPMTQVLKWKPFRESLDLLYQNIQLLSRESPLKSLVVTSALAGEGKSTLILGLAISAARLHQRVLLIDGDLRRPSLHKLLNLPNEKGFSTLLATNAKIPDEFSPQPNQQRNNIAVLTAGPTPADPAKLLSSSRMKQVIAAFEQSYDLVLIDAPPAIGMVDAILEGSCCSGVVLVSEVDRVTRAELNQATGALGQLNLIGVVANRASSTATSDRLDPVQVSMS